MAALHGVPMLRKQPNTVNAPNNWAIGTVIGTLSLTLSRYLALGDSFALFTPTRT
jgi:hypothetical protein